MANTHTRKNPKLLSVVIGMLESSARLDEEAAKKRRVEAKSHGSFAGPVRMASGKVGKMIRLPVGQTLSLGTTVSAQVLAGLAAELALKYAYEADYPRRVAPGTHKLYSGLYSKLSDDRKRVIETDYIERVQRHSQKPSDGWETAERVFRSANNYFEYWRYIVEPGQENIHVEPIFLREATASVLKTLGCNIRWSSEK